MRKLLLVTTLIFSSSIAFAQFTGPSVDRESAPRRDNMGQAQNHPCMNNPDGKPCDVNQRMNQRNDGQRADGSSRKEMQQERQHRQDNRRDNRHAHHNGARHDQHNRANHRRGDMKQNIGNQQRQQQSSDSNSNSNRRADSRQGRNINAQ